MTYQSPISPGYSWYEANVGNRPRYPRLDGDAVADIAIVGGGFTGLSAAAHLAKTGANVVLIEAHRFGDGASGRNGGQLGTGQRAWAEELEEELRPQPRARRCSSWPKRPSAHLARIRPVERHRHRLHARASSRWLTSRATVDDYKAHAEMHGDPLRLSAYPLHGCRGDGRRGSARRTISAASATPAPAISTR